MQYDCFFSSEVAHIAIQKILKQARLIRIATAYFEPSGYQVLQDVLVDKELRLLVGRSEGGRDRIEAVLREFENALMDAPLEKRMQSMRQMLDALMKGYLQVHVVDSLENPIRMDARYLYHHAKLYIADESAVVVTSANMSYQGLIRSREAGYTVRNDEDVIYFVNKFDILFEQAESITQPLIDKLMGYVASHKPFEVYIRCLIELYRLPEESVSPELPILADYQKPVVSRVLNAILDYKGAMLIASTGLGKTVMAAHIVAYLNMEKQINRVIVISPAGLRDQWKRYMWMANLASDQYSYSNLSTEKNKSLMARNLDYALRYINKSTLIILDESHHMRNKDDLEGEKKLRFKRVHDAVRQSGAQILMLTATPFSRNIDDINAQLELLPLSEYATLNPENHHHQSNWEIKVTADLPDLPPCAVLTTPSVVSRFSHNDDSGERYVIFGQDTKRYFPRRLRFHTEFYTNPLDELLIELLESGLLNQQASNQPSLFGEDFEQSGQKRGLFNAEIMKQFCSSPDQVESLFKKLENNSFEKMRFAHQEALSRFVSTKRLFVQSYKSAQTNPKVKRIFEIIEKSQNYPSQKIIIFCHYIESAKQLADLINSYPFIKQVNAETTAGRDPEMIDTIIKRFAPIANEFELSEVDKPIHILIATGALAEGFNLQDASILINYDLSWTVLALAQRLGRILRPWHEPREIDIYNFIPSTMRNEKIRLAINWYDRLHERNRQHLALADIPVLLDEADKTEEEIEMQELAQNFRIFEQETTLNLDQTLKFIQSAQKINTSSFWDDLTRISVEEKKRVEVLPFGFRSVRLIETGKKCLFILFHHKNRYYPALFDTENQLLMDSDERDKIMNFIRCDPSEPVAPPSYYIDDNLFDQWLDKCRETWTKQNNIPVYLSVQIVCAMALVTV